ncbi:MAG TPA: MBL fold metallo-hydrolase [Gemmatimonadales bacterium]|nr:MBL fold metallo-hydrolase [Gemmatimonadales bacterium]
MTAAVETDRVVTRFVLLSALSVLFAPSALAQITPRPSAFSPTTETTVYPLRRLDDGVYAVLGDTGKGAEGRPNAGFVVTNEGVVAIGGLASPAQARAVIRTIRTVSTKPVRYLILYAHHPDMMFGAIEFKRVGAKIIAHPDTRVLAGEAGPDAMVADWDGVVGLQELLGFEYANTPDRPVTGTDTLVLGDKTILAIHPGAAHSAGDLMVWLPRERVLFAGDILLPDGVTMVVDGNSSVLLRTLDQIDSMHPKVIVPGHDAIPHDPATMVQRTREYFAQLREAMGAAIEKGTSMRQALASLPPPDDRRPVSLHSRERRNAVRVYLEMERAKMGLEDVQEGSQ